MTNEDRLIKICADVLNVDPSEVSLETECGEDGDFDSLTIVMIIAEIQDTFGCTINEDTLKKIKIEKVSDFLKLIG